jgi:tetratricopeptide (TPR) repeat protein
MAPIAEMGPIPTINKVLDTVNLEALGVKRDELLDELIRTPFGNPSARQTESEIANLQIAYWRALNKLFSTPIIGAQGEEIAIRQMITEDKNAAWAATILRSMVDSDNTRPGVLNNLGFSYLWLGEFEPARRAFQQALNAPPEVPASDRSQESSTDVSSGEMVAKDQGISTNTLTTEMSLDGTDADDTAPKTPQEAARENLEYLKGLINILVRLARAKRNLSLAY